MLIAALRSIVASGPVIGLSPIPSCEAFEAFDGNMDQLDFFRGK